MPTVSAPGGGTPTGNPLSDANSNNPPAGSRAAALQGSPLTQAQADALNQANQNAAQVASDCLWPPSGQFTVPIIPGIYHQTVNIPCLLSYSEARAAAGAGILLGGLLVMGWGLSILAAVTVLPPVLRAVGITKGGKGAAARAGAPAEAAGAPAASEVALAA